jgi:hypothetical protein
LHRVISNDVVDVSEIHATSNFRFEIYGLLSFYVYILFFLRRNGGRGDRVMVGASYGLIITGSLCILTLKMEAVYTSEKSARWSTTIG